MSKATKTSLLEKQAYRPHEFQQAFGVSKTFFYEEILAGRLKVFKAGRSTFVSRASALAWLADREAESANGGVRLRRR